MSEKYLVRKKVILDAGIKTKDELEIIPFDNMRVDVVPGTLPSDVITLATEEQMEALVKAGISNSHKSIAGELEITDDADAEAKISSYNAGGDLTLTNGRILNNGNASPGEVIYFIPAVGSSWKTEEIIVGTRKELIPLTNENAIFGELEVISKSVEDNVANIATNTAGIAANKAALADKVDVAGYTAEAAAQDAQIQANTALTTAHTTHLSELEPKVTANQASVEDYFDNKADFVRLQDIQGAVDITADITGSESGNDVTFDLSGLDLSKLTADKLAVFKFDANNGTDESEYVSDSFNNGTGTGSNHIFGTEVTALSTDTLLTISGLSTPMATRLVNDYKLTLVSQLAASVGGGIDHTARTQAAAAQTTANAANAQSKTNATQIATNTSAIATKQDKIDNSLSTTTKSVVGAINELKQSADLADRLGGLKTTDGDDLSTTTEEIVTKKTLDAQTSHVSHASNSNFLGEFADVASLPTTATLGNYAFVGSGSTWLEYGYTDTNDDGTGDTWELIGQAPSGGANSVDEKRLWRFGTSSDWGALSAGENAGETNQGNRAVAIGDSAGNENQGDYTVAIGDHAGYYVQGDNSIALGKDAGQTVQGDKSIALGYWAGNFQQSNQAIAIGGNSGQEKQGENSIAIGDSAGKTDQPEASIAIGHNSKPTEKGGIYIGSSDVPANALEVKGGKLYIGGTELTSGPSWKDITSDLSTRTWTSDDIGKKVRVDSNLHVMTGFISKSNDTYYIIFDDVLVDGNQVTKYIWKNDSNNTKITQLGYENRSGIVKPFGTTTFDIDHFEIEE